MKRYHLLNNESSLTDLNTLLRLTKKKRLFPRKEAGIRVAFFYYDYSGKKHYLVLFGDREYDYYSIVDYNLKTQVNVEYICQSQKEKEALERIITTLEHAFLHRKEE